nr:MAG TPA: hypothetical protein [Caudoviricetes sp.]
MSTYSKRVLLFAFWTIKGCICYADSTIVFTN